MTLDKREFFLLDEAVKIQGSVLPHRFLITCMSEKKL